jgi:hypothetical protein
MKMRGSRLPAIWMTTFTIRTPRTRARAAPKNRLFKKVSDTKVAVSTKKFLVAVAASTIFSPARLIKGTGALSAGNTLLMRGVKEKCRSLSREKSQNNHFPLKKSKNLRARRHN